MFLVVVDAHSKWPEVVPMQSTTSTATIHVLRTIFARYGLPEHIVSDNGPQLTSAEFKEFLTENGIRHTTTAPYHLATNGLAERFVQTLKNALNTMKNQRSVEANLANFLLLSRNTPHTSTNECPSLLFSGRKTRMKLDLVRPDLKRNINDRLQKQILCSSKRLPRQFEVGEKVAVRDYRGKNRWAYGVVLSQIGSLHYELKCRLM